MRYRHSTRQIEEGFKQEVRLFRAQHPDLSFYECRMRVLNSFEDEVVLTVLDKEWLKKKREEIIKAKEVRSEKSARVQSIDDILENL